ncbi:probable methyltransferase-like protein 25 [Paramacrobiotus metropolitanus]|uniref:probable methyltransferase-like protein 25 n=1 Tax=Paramacrobiotus metropolitanus TaxID=2943436 RepID=UPI00244636F5|nr:probable methyltransferase-like protein 25 [Paramacrobiotus metropolitanus]
MSDCDRLRTLSELIAFLEPFHPLADIPLAPFITDNLFHTTVLPLFPSSQDADPALLFPQFWDFCVVLWKSPITEYPEARNPWEKLARDAACKCRLLVSGPPPEADAVDGKLASVMMMSEKKLQEICAMAPVVRDVAEECQVRQVVDVGCGKGYLSAWLSLRDGLDVLGVEMSASNIQGAATRLRRLNQQWNAVRKRLPVAGDSGGPGRLTFACQAVGEDAQLDGVDGRFVVCGLHACGSLSDHIIRMFQRNDQAAGLVLVPCCYHLMEERFEGGNCSAAAAFPSSTFLQSRRYRLGRNARMLASQSVERTLADRAAFERSVRALFFRALLQVVLRRHGLEERVQSVGSIKTVNGDFVAYAREALDDVPMDEEELEAVYREYAPVELQLRLVCLTRILLAPLIEQIILLDRACALDERDDIGDVGVVDLFDPRVSPRRWAVVAQKKL